MVIISVGKIMNCLRHRMVILLILAVISRHTAVDAHSSSDSSRAVDTWVDSGTYSYRHSSGKANWDIAMQQCRNQIGQIVTVLSQDEQTFIQPDDKSHWIGLKGNVDTGVYKWFNDRGISAFSNFHEDGAKGSSEQSIACVKIEKSGEWKNSKCSKDKQYICKRPICSDGQRLNSNAASRGDCLIHLSGSFTWSEARAACRSLQGDTDLASPTDQEFKNFLQNNFANDAAKQDFWLGARMTSTADVSLLSGQTTTLNSHDRDSKGGDCIAWLGQNKDFERHKCDQRLGAVCQRSIYYADYGDTPITTTTQATTTMAVTTRTATTTKQATTTMALTTRTTTQTTTTQTTAASTITSSESPTTPVPKTTKAVTTPVSSTGASTTATPPPTTTTTTSPAAPPSPTATTTTSSTATLAPTTATPPIRTQKSTTVFRTTPISTSASTTTKYELQVLLDTLAQSKTDETLDSAAKWILENPSLPDDLIDSNPENYTKRFLEVCSTMINSDHDSYWSASDASVEPSSFAGSCSSVVDDLAKNSDTDQVIITDNVVATTKVFPKADEFSDVNVGLVNDTGEVIISEADFEKLGIDANKKISVSIVSYKHGELLTGSNDDQAPVTGVVSITLFVDGVKTSLPVSFNLTIDKAKVENTGSDKEPTCVYQDIDTNGVITWVSDGCTVSGLDDNKVTCRCEHTTNFAVLMQVKDVKLAARDVIALDWITRVCCTLSIIALVVTLAVLLFVRSLIRSERVTIHTNLVIALILAQILLLVSGLAAKSESVCRAVAILMHYFFTAVFCWMLVEGIHLYMQIVQVFSAGKDKIRTYLAIGWGTPLLIVVITAASRWYGYGANGNCWLSTAYGMVWAFVAPALLIITVNFVILIKVLRILVISAKAKSDGDFDHIKAALKGAILLLPLLGTTWLFGVISISADTVVFLYLFAIFNSLQGVFIFFLYCVFNSEVRNAFTRQKEKRALTRGEMDSTSTSMSGGDSKSKSRSKPNRVHPDMATKDTQIMDIKSTTITTTHTKMVVEAHGPLEPDMPEMDDDPPPMVIGDVD